MSIYPYGSYQDKWLNFLQISLIREGMAGIIPVPLLTLLTAQSIEQLVCGTDEVKIDVLQKVVRWEQFLHIFSRESHHCFLFTTNVFTISYLLDCQLSQVEDSGYLHT